jgi:hypothetical protein
MRLVINNSQMRVIEPFYTLWPYNGAEGNVRLSGIAYASNMPHGFLQLRISAWRALQVAFASAVLMIRVKLTRGLYAQA